MAAFEYTALDSSGRQKKGVMEADTPRQMRSQLRDKGMTPLSVTEVQQKESRRQSGRMSFGGRGLSAADQSLITRQLATLVRVGTPVDEALKAVSRQSEKPRVTNMMLAVRAKVKEGHPLATALGDFPHAFDELFRATVSAGEQSGHLDGVLERLADYTETRQVLQQKFQMALIYPVLIALVAIGVVVGLLAYVVPKIVGVFANTGQELPMLTQMLIAVSDGLQTFWPWIIGGLIGGGLLANYLLKQEKPLYAFHIILLRLPLIGRLTRGLNAARFARTLSILVGSGVPVLEAMQISSEVVANRPMRAAVEDTAQRVREGASISKALETSGYFPPMTVHLIASGESSGNLDEMLERAASAQEREVETMLGMLMAIFEPVMILIMGGVVLMIVLAILMPIIEMNNMVG